MTPDELNNIAVELKRLGSELNLSDQQKDQLKTFLTDKYEKFQEYKQQNPNVSKEDVAQYLAKNRSAGREKLEKFLTPEQLTEGTCIEKGDWLKQSPCDQWPFCSTVLRRQTRIRRMQLVC